MRKRLRRLLPDRHKHKYKLSHKQKPNHRCKLSNHKQKPRRNLNKHKLKPMGILSRLKAEPRSNECADRKSIFDKQLESLASLLPLTFARMAPLLDVKISAFFHTRRYRGCIERSASSDRNPH